MFYLIPANAEWTNTGVELKATPHEKILEITVEMSDPNRNRSRWTANPNPQGGGPYDARGFQGHRPIGGGYKVQHADEGCLIGKIDETAFVFTFDKESENLIVNEKDKEITLKITVAGQLEGRILMGINDNPGGLVDNSGSIVVKRIDINGRAANE